MKKIPQKIITLAMVFVAVFSMLENVQAQGYTQLASAASATTPIQQVVVYRNQSVAYDNFSAAIFAQGQLGEAPKLPTGSDVVLYVDPNKVDGTSGLQTGVRCSVSQASADYYQDTITMDKRFCADFNDAILDGRAVYGLVPTEAVFLHNANGQRCYAAGSSNTVYLTNPASTFFRNYLVNRGSEKLKQFGMTTLFLDNLQAGWSGITSRCGGAPKEYSNSTDYLTQMVGLAQYVNDNLPAYKIEGNLANASSQWDKFSFLDAAMCESCFTNWGGSWPSATRMLSDLSVMDKWIKAGHKIYIVSQAPDTTAASNRFTFAASLLVTDGSGVYFHFGADYSQFYSIPEYKYNLGLPTAAYICNGNICTRTFERGTVTVDFGKLEGVVALSAGQATPTATLPLPTATLPLPTATLPRPTATLPTAIPTLFSPTPIVLPSLTATISPTFTSTQIPFTATATSSPIPPTATKTSTPTAMPQPTNTNVVSSGPNSVNIRVSSGIDDVEENSSGAMSTNSNDLELIYDNSAQVVGIRFRGVKIPKGAVITNAYVQFKTDQPSSQTIQLTINGEASANASAFTTSSRNVSKRIRTSSKVIWSPAAWSKIGEAGKSQQTPSLNSIVQEIVNQANWNSGNSLVIIVTGKSGKRVAKSYEGEAAGSPLLHVEFSLPAQPTLTASPTAIFTATATMLVPSASPTTIPVTSTPASTQLPPPTSTVEATSTAVIPTETPVPTTVPPSPTVEVIVPMETPIP